ncbi:MAG: DUF5009 domain-containing protein, partial [Candidatus Marinimicrobia bacterium]|nr:DUF5009 domain-containing protein [Candidatus Neomarinimicrobiota bacterium]
MSESITKTKSKRMVSLDVLRGATIAAMILVNNPGSHEHIYAQLQHAEWHGWTFTDWIFPFFLFMVGISMVLSFRKRLNQGASRQSLLIHVLRRSAILFAIGLFINGFPFGLLPGTEFSFSTWRIMGILQRIGLAYFCASLIFLYTDLRGQVLSIVAILIGYWLMLRFIPVPGFGAGVLEPKGNLCWFIDSHLLNTHTWRFAPVEGFDPEGLLSTIPAITSILFGVMTGHWLRKQKTPAEKTAGMFVVGNILLLFGVIWSNWFPINKNLWTSSYVVFMAGWALISLAMIYWIVDVKGYQKWSKPFVIFGVNAITVFTLAELLASFLWSIIWRNQAGDITTLHDVIYEKIFL